MKRLLSILIIIVHTLHVAAGSPLFSNTNKLSRNKEIKDSLILYPFSKEDLRTLEETTDISFESIIDDNLETDDFQLGEDIGIMALSDDGIEYDVGEIPYHEDITPYGGRTYNVPLMVTPLAKSYLPIGLQYNSQAGNGLAGYGWDISGLSAIVISNKNLYYNNKISPANINNTDSAYSLDGIPLVLNDDADLSSDYPLETAKGHILVKKHMSGDVVSYFSVLYPDGSKAIYGLTSNTESKAVYPITHWEDRLGNQVSYNYLSTNSDYSIVSILFKHKNNSSYIGRLQFQYTERTDYHTRYRAGQPSYQNKILKQVISVSDGETLYTYNLVHELCDGVNLLKAIECTGGSGAELRPLQFGYGNSNTQNSTSSPNFVQDVSLTMPLYFSSGDNSIIYRRGKYAEGSYSDGIVSVPNFSTYNKIGEKWEGLRKRSLYGSTYSPDQNILITPVLPNTSCIKTILAESEFQYIDAADTDGDGVDEIVKINFDGTATISGGTGVTYLKITVYKYDVRTNTISIYKIHRPYVMGNFTDGSLVSPSDRCYFMCDYDADGKTELLTISYNKDPEGNNKLSYTATIDLDTGEKTSEVALLSLSKEDYVSGKIFCVDMEGDGKSELCHATSSGLNIYTFTGTHFVLNNVSSDISSADLDKEYNITDINGDGYVDIAVHPESRYQPLRFYLYDGQAFVEYSFQIGSYGESDEIVFFDVNKDGLADLIHRQSLDAYLYLNENGVFKSSNSIMANLSLASNGDIIPCNIRQYSSMSDFITICDYRVKTYKFSQDLSRTRLMTRFTNSMGLTTVNIYSDMASSNEAYKIDQNRTYNISKGFSKTRFPLLLLYQTQTHMTPAIIADNRLNQFEYNYYDACTHAKGLGFCGFGKICIEDLHKNLISTTIFDPEKMGVTVKTVQAKLYSSDTPYEIIENIYDNHSTTYGKLNPRLISTSQENTLTTLTNTISYSYDQYDYPVLIKQSSSYKTSPVSSNVGLLEEETSFTYLHKDTLDLYCLGLVTSNTHTDIIPENDNYTPAIPASYWIKKQVLTYNDKGQPLVKIDSVGNSLSNLNIEQETQWTYDSYGNVIKERSAPYGVPLLMGKMYSYDENGINVISTTNELGQTTSYSDYNKYGKPSYSNDHKGRLTSYVYDGWGNLISSTAPDGTTSSYSSAWGGAGAYTVTTSVTGQPKKITHYDAAGRQVRSGNQRYNNTWIYTDVVYDITGQIKKVSVPFKSNGSATLWDVYEYDDYLRPISYIQASGNVTTWVYDGRKTTESKNGIWSTKTLDAKGRVIQVRDSGGTISYSLQADGQPTEVTVSGGKPTTFEYNIYGLRSKIIDASAGTQTETIRYLHDRSSTITHTNPNGTIITHADRYGRTTKVERLGEYTTEYTYNQDGLLVSEISSNGTSKSYTYDGYDRVLTLTETVPDGKWLKKTYTYTTGSNVNTIAYESQNGVIATESFAYSNGTNIRIGLQGTHIRLINAENEFGQPTSVTTGGITRTYSYNAYGMQTRRTMGSVMDYSYTFDPLKGNLMSRTDNLRNQTETFGYDALNRLTAIDDREITYADNGNITSIDSVGDMTYDNSAKPYQVTSLTLEEDIVPSRVQNVTYTCYSRPSIMTEGGRSAAFTYNGDGARVKMNVSDGATSVLARYYIGNQYELDVTPNGTTERLYLGGDAYSAPAVYIKEGSGAWTFYNIGRDYLGNITHIATADGILVEENSYDPWGRLRNPETKEIYSLSTEPELMLGRGYTGHEHLTWFGLINMNARLYDPVLGRFLSPDPFVQMPDFTQNFNRYLYCLNNPLIFVDKSGEYFVVDSFLVGLLGGGWKRAVKMAKNDLKIWGGLFATDRNKNILGRAWEFISRFTWQLPQTLGGFITAHTYNTCRLYKGVESVSYLYGATVVRTNGNGFGAVTQSSFIVGDCDLEANPSNELFQHEYGHYLQSQDIGPLYYLTIGIPSFISARVNSYDDHNRTIMEQDCNIRAFKYFNKNVSSFTYMDENGNITSSWNFASNPIVGYDRSQMPDSEHNKSVLRNRISWDIRVNREINGVEPSVLMEPSLDTFYHVVL